MQQEQFLQKQIKEIKKQMQNQAGLLSKVFDMLESITDFKNTPFMTRKQVAAYFHVSTRTVDRWKDQGQLLPIYKDRRVLYYKEDVLEFSENNYNRI